MTGRDELLDAARQAGAAAYAPYSGFTVGAAVECEHGEVVAGCNVENASYGASLCAERNAVAAAVAKGLRSFTAMAICTPASPPAPPCGLCRQVMAEFNPGMTIYLTNPQGEVTQTTLDALFPSPFDPGQLPRTSGLNRP